MKKLYVVLSLLFFAGFAIAQNGEAVATSCKNVSEETVTIIFDESLNCTVAPGDLAGMESIGFHSGTNGWQGVVDWNAATALTAANDGNDVFTVSFAPVDYYGVAWGDLNEINFVYNQGPSNEAEPWGSEGKDNNADGSGCADFKLIIADMAECVSSTVDQALVHSLAVTPNPFSEKAVISFSNPNNQVYDITVTGLTGQVVRRFQNVSGNAVELERGNLLAGMYFVTFQAENGKIATTKVVVR